jgi:hypothetical protein
MALPTDKSTCGAAYAFGKAQLDASVRGNGLQCNTPSHTHSAVALPMVLL